MDSHCQLSERARPDGIFAVLKVSYCALGKSRPAREELSGKLLGSCPDFFQILRVNYSFVLAERFIRWVHRTRFGHHGQIGTARPAGGCFSADVMKLTCDNMPAHKQADCSAGAYAAVGRAKFAFRAGQKAIDFVLHRAERKPSQ